MKIDLALLRYRAATRMSLCSGQHVIRRSDDGGEVWVECDGGELNRLTIDARVERGLDLSNQIHLFTVMVMAEHETDVVSKIVLELIDRVEQGSIT